jgi:hypothetical protein
MAREAASRAAGVLAAIAAATVLVAACDRSPAEPVPPVEAAAPSSTSVAAPVDAAAPGASASSPAPEAVEDAGGADAAATAQRTFCSAAFSADLERMRAKCNANDLALMQAMSKAASNLCSTDLGVGLARGRAGIDAEAGRRCVEMLQKKELEQTSDDDSLFLHFPCDRVVLGLQAEGQPCRFSIECKDGLACVGYAIGGDGTCKKPPKVKEACTLQPFGTVLTTAAATLHHPACVAGAYCDGAVCQPRITQGKACNKSEWCAGGLSCVQGKCGPRGAAGAACAASSDCAFGMWCERAFARDATGKCAAKRGDGETCPVNDACKGRCDMPRGPDGKPTPPGKCLTMCGSG